VSCEGTKATEAEGGLNATGVSYLQHPARGERTQAGFMWMGVGGRTVGVSEKV
jgi:hypothetical protein